MYRLGGQSGSQYVVSIGAVYASGCLAIYWPCGQSGSQYIASAVRVAHNILPRWSEWLTIYCTSSYRPHRRYVLAYIAHVVRVSRHIASGHIAHVSKCIAIYRTWPEYLGIYCPCGQSGSRYIMSIYCVHLVSMSQHILPMWPEHHGIYCLCGQSGSPYIVPVHTVHIVGMSQHILPVWSGWLTLCCISLCCLTSEWLTICCISLCCPHVRPSQNILPVWSVWLTLCCINPLCPHRRYVSEYSASVVRVAHDILYQADVMLMGATRWDYVRNITER